MTKKMVGQSAAVYGISVAAELVGLGQQTLRQYENKGLIEPERTAGGTRRYSDLDLVRLRRIAELLACGLNLAGIRMVLGLEAANLKLRRELKDARQLSAKGDE
ncbi:MerR family transcriptional regulator [Saxibacter everestensis]|uniref:MerR family transcriptional regulator n=1 Tax=Saxibacter everestensis TaxID=2909229 RepID=A0ABY8QYW9_9MICO|nr:MerR family transcriptional regulator [Brevibacteriaceae bacterium ZFBP1038]